MWDRSTRDGKRFIAHFLTYAKMAERSQDDQIDKSIMVHPQTTDVDTSTDKDKIMLNTEPKTPTVTPANDKEGKSTRPPRPQTAEETLGHQTSTPQPKQNQTESKKQHEALRKAQKRAEKIANRGCSEEKPVIARNAIKTTWSVGRLYILRELHDTLKHHTRYEADAIYARARTETQRDYPYAWTTSADWDYWIPRFPHYPPAERHRVIMRDVLPLLKNSAVTPHERKKFKSGDDYPLPQGVAKLAGPLAPFLKKIMENITDPPTQPAPKPTPIPKWIPVSTEFPPSGPATPEFPPSGPATPEFPPSGPATPEFPPSGPDKLNPFLIKFYKKFC
jgi:hypothetical protein